MYIEYNDDWLIKDIYEHQKTKNMKYQIGDKVKTDVGNGVVCNVSESLVAYHVRTEKHGVILRRANQLTWLPKYAVGDVVRFKHEKCANQTVAEKYGLIATIKTCNAHDDIYTLHEHPENYTESCFEPFDGFRVGDTVWTLRRGKGKIVSDRSPYLNRLFFVRFENDTCDRTPKHFNLIPTEAKYKEVLKSGYKFTIDYGCVTEYVPKPEAKKFPSGGIVEPMGSIMGYKFYKNGLPIDPRTEKLVWMDKEPAYFGKVQVAPSAKFKVGDVVFYDHLCSDDKKWKISGYKTYNDGREITYTIIQDTRHAKIGEADLRLWKETELRWRVVYNEKTPELVEEGIKMKTSDFKSVEHLGTSILGLDIFCAKNTFVPIIFFGTKGDDIS